jgi:hypothetical protein
MTRPTYRVTVTREDGYWVAVAAGLRGGATETRRLSRLEEEVRDLVSWLTDAAADSFDLTWEYDLPSALATQVVAFAERRDALERAQEAYESAARHAVAEARKESISVRDTGALLGLSHQRVQQIDAAIRGSSRARSRVAAKKASVPVMVAKEPIKQITATSKTTPMSRCRVASGACRCPGRPHEPISDGVTG